MPYYCTVPRCTSMAGKAKNVSFHQFPRDVELARLWNEILKRGKPYTKYSKVCSLHFRPEDYTITSVGKNKGQWRTLRKDAIPSQNLPSDSPTPSHRSRGSGAWLPDGASSVDPRVQQQIAQAIYLQTMIAMQAAVNGTQPLPIPNIDTSNVTSPENTLSLSEMEQIIRRRAIKLDETRHHNGTQEWPENSQTITQERTSYKCDQCSKCFKDPDVFILHKRIHNRNQMQDTNNITSSSNEKENFDANTVLSKQDTLKANPILANLLKSNPSSNQAVEANVFDMNTILSVENHIMQALAANMESYIRNLSSTTPNNDAESDGSDGPNDDDKTQSSSNSDDQKSPKVNSTTENLVDDIENVSSIEANTNSSKDNHLEANENSTENENVLAKTKDTLEADGSQGIKPDCDNEDLNISKDSNNLVIDETV